MELGGDIPLSPLYDTLHVLSVCVSRTCTCSHVYSGAEPNIFLADRFGEQFLAIIRGGLFEGLFVHKLLIWSLAFISQLALLQRWPLKVVPLYRLL